jgi:hypothetical protein
MKKILYFCFITVAILSIIYLVNTYALLETNAQATITEDVGKWQIKLNNTDISHGITNSFNINNLVYTDNANIDDNVIAPGRSGYFDIVIDPSGTDVSIRYDITLNINSDDYPANINFNVADISDNSTIKSDINTYSGTIDLNNIKLNKTLTLRITVNWQDNINYDTSDSNIGTKEDTYINIPATVKVSQYLGETIVPYS